MGDLYSRPDGLFNTYEGPDGTQIEADDIKEALINRIKKKGPSYSQIQNKKKKIKKKTDKKKQTFYEKVLSKNLGEPLAHTYDYSRQEMEQQYHYDPMNKTQNLMHISAHIPEAHFPNSKR